MASMAATDNSGYGRGRERASGNSIVIAGDRTKSRLAATRHSRRVRTLKIALPAFAVAMTGFVAMNILGNAGVGPVLPPLEVPKIVADNLKMHNPHYQGFNADGGHYWVKAETAQQDLKALTAVHLDGITGELTDAKKQKTYLTAVRGIFDNKSNILELYESINVTGDGGLNAKLTRATIQTKENIITSDQPSTILMSAGQITSNQLTIRQKTKEYTFLENVRTHLQPKPASAEATNTAAQNALPFGKPGQPVDVAANRLDIDDVKKTAIYSGQVVATQDGATMTSPEMTVTYEGAVAPGAKGEKPPTDATAASDPASTKVKLIVAKDSVVLQQPNGQTATSRAATFDTVANTAVLEGDVVLTQGDDRKAVGDRVDYDQAAQTMILTGPVVVTQGANILKGRRLVYNRATQKMQLSAPANVMGGTSVGRITAHFVKPSTKGNATQSSDNDDSGDGISFGAAFKSDPNAPYDVVADRLDVDDNAKNATFTGNVSAVQGAVTMRSQELMAFYTGSAGMAPDDKAGSETAKAPAALTHLTAKKKVVVTAKDGQTATGDWAEVDVKKNLTTLGGAVVLTQGKNIVHGTRLVIDMNTGEATIKTEPTGRADGAVVSSSDGDGKGTVFKAERPSAIFYPGQLKKSKIQADGWQVRTSP
ncbi:LPS export ABC transporter periplasmic protein LptC [Hyphomicrobium sp.]|uniref:LPS export ABC transporter periplasmic protein LptC n=1 Tax=Hyphomicrobium sp. TaxID=82 RepID=UPI000F996CC1|nr:LPS export ABC transporter periplasmic protein LptC [Hyphomicrobium sp.]RUO98287.1 MAG: LPS export ABC transporter periplasmic protein LptC [Hyphomicrobium sp.]